MSSIKRSLWLFKCANLTSIEVLNVFVNKFIYFIAKYYYSIKSWFLTGDFNIIYDYKKHLNKNNVIKGRALVSFLRFPVYKENFIGRMKYFFSNNGIVLNLAKGLNQLGYAVDIIDSAYDDFRSRHKYDIIIFHNINSFDLVKNNAKDNAAIFFFDTGAYWRVYAENIKTRFQYFQERKGIDILSQKKDFFEWLEKKGCLLDELISRSDGIITVGDQLAKSYDKFPMVYKINNGFYEDKFYKKTKTAKDLNCGRNNFLFFGGGIDNFRKGLDVLLEVFAQNPDKNLYVCAKIDPLLEKVYHLAKQPNIHLLGYLKQQSKKFYEIIVKCDFVIQPSCNEGTPGGILDCMQYGLIPIVTKECNIDVRDFGILLDDYHIETISRAINAISGEPADFLLKHSEDGRKYLFENFSERAFLKNMKDIIGKIIRKTKIN